MPMFEQLPKKCQETIIGYGMVETKWLLRKGIDSEKLDVQLNTNPHAVDFLLDHPHRMVSLIARHDHPRLVRYLLSMPKPFPQAYRRWLSINPNEEIVDYLLTNEEEIDNYSLCENTNDRMVDFFIANWPLRFTGNRSGLYKNPNDRMIDFILMLPHMECGYFFHNQNPRSARYLLETHPDFEYDMMYHFYMEQPPLHEEWIDLYIRLAENTPPRWNTIAISQHPHQRAVTYLLQHPHNIHQAGFCRNSNEDAVSYILSHLEKMIDGYYPKTKDSTESDSDEYIEWVPPYLSFNTNPRIIDFLIRHPWNINWSEWSRNPAIFVASDVNIDTDEWIQYLT